MLEAFQILEAPQMLETFQTLEAFQMLEAFQTSKAFQMLEAFQMLVDFYICLAWCHLFYYFQFSVIFSLNSLTNQAVISHLQLYFECFYIC